MAATIVIDVDAGPATQGFAKVQAAATQAFTGVGTSAAAATAGLDRVSASATRTGGAHLTGAASVDRFKDSLEANLRTSTRHEAMLNRASGLFQQIGGAAGGATGGLEALASTISVFASGPLAAAAAGGALLLAVLKSYQTEADKALAKTTALSRGMGEDFARMLTSIKRITAESSGDVLGVAEANFARIRLDAAQARDDTNATSLATAREAVSLLSPVESTTAALTMLAQERAAHEATYQNAIRVGEVQLQADIMKFNQARADFLTSLTATSTAAAQTRRDAEVAASGSIVAAYENERDKTLAGIATTAAADRQRLTTMRLDVQQAFDARVKIEQTALDRTVAAEITAARARKAAIESLTAASLSIFEKLGAGFEDIANTLRIQSVAIENAKALTSLTDALTLGVLTQEQYNRGAQGLKTSFDQLVRAGGAVKKGTEDIAQAQTAAVASTQALATSMSQDLAAAFVSTGTVADDLLDTITRLRAAGQAAMAETAAAASASRMEPATAGGIPDAGKTQSTAFTPGGGFTDAAGNAVNSITVSLTRTLDTWGFLVRQFGGSRELALKAWESLPGTLGAPGTGGGGSLGIQTFAGGLDVGPMPGSPSQHYLAWLSGGEWVMLPDQIRTLIAAARATGTGDHIEVHVHDPVVRTDQDPARIAAAVAQALSTRRRRGADVTTTARS